MSPITKINKLIDSHPNSFMDCSGCEICDRIQEISSQWQEDSTQKPAVKSVLDKGKAMTKSDIIYLLYRGVKREQIRRALKMTGEDFYNMLHSWGLSKNERQKTKKKPFFTEKELAIAEEHNVDRHTAWNRIRKYGWTREAAITTPVRTYTKGGKQKKGS